MSRYFKKLEEKNQTVAYGFDNATGYFFQLFDDESDTEDHERLLVDECSTFTKMSNGRMLELMMEYKVDPEHVDMVTLDLTF